MKKNESFENPQRQSQYAIIFIILRFLRKIVLQIWPIFLALALGRSNSSFDFFELSIAGIGIFGMIASILAYFKYYFHLTDSELIISQGILKRVKLNVPFERIQSVNFRQTFLHQFFQVTEVEIETAGSAEQETKIDAIEIPKAELLRTLILEKKGASLTKIDEQKEQANNPDKTVDTILKLSPKELVRVGLVQNHLRPIGLFFGLIGTVIGYSYSFDYSGEFFIKKIYKAGEEFFRQFYHYQEDFPIVYIVFFIILLIIISVLYSVITTILRHFNLHFWRSGSKFLLVQGLITRKEFAALDNKIQILNWGQNPFERLIGFYNLQFHQAISGTESQTQGQFGIPGCQLDQVDYVKESWLGPNSGQFDEYFPISIHYFIRSAIYQCLFFGLISIACIALSKIQILMFVLIIWILRIWLTWVTFKKKKYAINDSELYIGGGIVGFRHSILPLFKVQNVSIIQNPYQWRRDLATIIIYTAGGQVKIPYISYVTAKSLMDKFTFHLESSQKSWM